MEFGLGTATTMDLEVTVCYRQDLVENIAKAIAQIVHNDHIISSFQEF